MGVFSDLLAGTPAFDVTNPIHPLDKVVHREIDEMIARGDASYPVGSVAGDEVQSLAVNVSSSGNFTMTVNLKSGETFTTGSLVFDAVANINAVHTIAQDATDHTGGTFALTVTLQNGETFTTAGIAFNAAAATIETAIDVAATGVITGWTNGDITVTGGILQAAGADVLLTFDGTSVDLTNHPITVFDPALLTGGSEPGTRVTITNAVSVAQGIDSAATTASVVGWSNGDITVSGGDANTSATVLTFDGTSVAGLNHPLATTTDVDLNDNTPGVITQTTAGLTGRPAWGCLVAMGIAVAADIPEQGSDPADFVSPSNPSHANYPSEGTIRALAASAAITDENAVVETKILAAAGLV